MNNVSLPIRKFPCPGCGADLDFNPQLGQLKCPYCDREEVIPQTAADIQAHDYEEYFSGKRTRLSQLAAAAVELDCPDCGAGMIFEPPDAAGQCPFCAANLSIAQTRLASATLAPEGIVPFGCERATAREQLQRWLQQRWFAPSGFRQLVQPDKLEGVYLPHWAYDFQTTTRYTGQRGKSVGDRTRWQNTSGVAHRSFQNILVPATTAVSADRLHALRPWRGKGTSALTKPTCSANLLSYVRQFLLLTPLKVYGPVLDNAKQPLQANLHVYSSAYLAGFKAQRPQVSLKAGFETAQKQVQEAIKEAICLNIGGDRQRISEQSTTYSAVTFKLVLLPVWLCAYRYQGKRYQATINGCTQKLEGNYPISKHKRCTAIAISIIMLLTLWNIFPVLFFLLLMFGPGIIILFLFSQSSQTQN